MLGLGEEEDEIRKALKDLGIDIKLDVLTLGNIFNQVQNMHPSKAGPLLRNLHNGRLKH